MATASSCSIPCIAEKNNHETSLGVEIRIASESKGRGLFATKPFKENDIIFEELPLVCAQFSWNAAYKYLACDHCMKPLETAEENARRLTGNPELILPYPECSIVIKGSITRCGACGAQYCSSECQEVGWNQYHKTLCMQSECNPAHPLYQLNEVWKQMHYPPETTTVTLLARILATVRQAGDKEAAVAAFMQLCHKTVNSEGELVHKLLGEKFEGQLKMIQELLSQALHQDCVHHWLTAVGFRSLLALVGTNGQGVGTTSVGEWARRCDALDLPEGERARLDQFVDKLYEDMDRESGTFLNNEGSALYAMQSACNHSCEPNAQPTFPHSNFKLALRASRDIAPGDEILISYLDDCQLASSRHSRQKFLRENYVFSCWCSKCIEQADDPDVTSEEDSDEEDEMDEL